jgi:filamentous hemagglutinin family protein
MNHIYRSIWNEKTGAFVAVSENASSGGKKASSSCGVAGAAHFVLKTLAASLMLAMGANVYALPPTGTVTAGAATISSAPGSMVINQSTQNVAINWQSFNIAAGESVQFVQPNSNSVALNRVVGTDPSSILGNLSANGKVFLVNPNGILFGKGASVNVGGLVGSTLGISDQDFMAGRYQFAGADTGAIVNQGVITADGGYVALVGGNVGNQGTITANRGTVALAAGKAVTLDVLGGQLLNVTVDQAALGALVQNGGLVQADGGQVLMTAQAAGSLLSSAVNNSGVIRAQTVENHQGVIRLLGDPANGSVTVGGTVDASGRGAGQTGGQVTVLGKQIAVLGKATIDVSGDAGGGTVLVGGNYQGKGTELHATTTVIGDGAGIHADAVRSGNGGQIVVWSDGETAVGGTLTARGGADSGNGGLIETSGKHVTRGANARVDTLAPNGKTGLWLLDPVNYKIAISGGDETPAQVTLSLASSNRVISATNDITVADALTWTTAQTLELNAGHDVRVDATITASTAGSGIKLVAGNDVALKAGAAITASANGSVIDLGAGGDIVIDGAVTADGGGAVNMRANNNIKINAAISSAGGNAAGGTVTLRADNDGTGPGIVGGTVIFTGTGGVSARNTNIFFNPDGYGNTASEIAAYSAKVVGALDARAWVFVQGNNKTYDGTRAATLSFRGTPSQGGDVTLTAGSATFNDKNVGVNKPIDYSGYSLGGANMANFALFDGGTGKTSANITPLAIVGGIAAASKVYDGNNIATITSRTLAGQLAGDTVSYTGGSATFVDKNVGDGKTVTGTGLGLSGADAGNYSVNTVAVTAANITPAPLLVTAGNVTKVYGQTPTLSAYTATTLRNGETIGSVTLTSAGTAPTAPVAGPYAIIPSAATGGTFTPSNYTITYVNGVLLVTPAPLTITARDVTKVYGQTPTLSAYSSTALQNGEAISSVILTSAGTAPTAPVPGPYAIIPSAAAGTFTPSNYTITYVNGALVVTPAPLTVTASDATKVYGDTPVLTAFTSTPLQNGETIGSVTETSAGTVASASAPGPYAIVPSAATGGTFTPSNYTIAYVNGSLAVTAAGVPPTGIPGGVPAAFTPPTVVVPSSIVPPAVAPTVLPPPIPLVVVPPSPPFVAPPAATPPPAATLPPPAATLPPPAATLPPPVATLPPPAPPVAVPPETPAVPETPLAPPAPPPERYVPPQYPRKQDRN